MKKTIMLAITLIAFAVPILPAAADPPSWAPAHGRRDKERYRDDDYRESRRDDDHREGHRDRGYVMSHEDRVFRGHDGHYHCHRRDGTVGIVVGAALGGVVGNKLDDGGALGTFLGAGAGALLGRAADGGSVRCQ